MMMGRNIKEEDHFKESMLATQTLNPLMKLYAAFNEIIFPKALTQLDGRPKILSILLPINYIDNDLVLCWFMDMCI